MKHMKTFRTADGRRIRVLMDADEIRQERTVTLSSIVVPTVTFILFVWASGILG